MQAKDLAHFSHYIFKNSITMLNASKRSCPLEEMLATPFLVDVTLALSFPLAKLLLRIVVTIFKVTTTLGAIIAPMRET
jgi:hypothetical protein